MIDPTLFLLLPVVVVHSKLHAVILNDDARRGGMFVVWDLFIWPTLSSEKRFSWK